MSLQYGFWCADETGDLPEDSRLHPGENGYASYPPETIEVLFYRCKAIDGLWRPVPPEGTGVGDGSVVVDLRAWVETEHPEASFGFLWSIETGEPCDPQEVLTTFSAIQETIRSHESELPKYYEFRVILPGESAREAGTQVIAYLAGGEKGEFRGGWGGVTLWRTGARKPEWIQEKRISVERVRLERWWRGEVEVDEQGPAVIEVVETSFREIYEPSIEEIITICQTALRHGWKVGVGLV